MFYVQPSIEPLHTINHYYNNNTNSMQHGYLSCVIHQRQHLPKGCTVLDPKMGALSAMHKKSTVTTIIGATGYTRKYAISVRR